MKRRAHRPGLVLGLSVLLVLALGACGSGGGESGDGGDHSHGGAASEAPEQRDPPFEKADATASVDVVLQDYAFVGVPTTPVTGPNVRFETTIKGSNTHELEIVDAAGATVDEIPAHQGGKPATLAVVLSPGTYTLQCLVKEGARTHADLGMKATLTVA